MSDWRSFWDGEHAIYVSDRHKAVHYQAIADGILAHVAAAGLGNDAVVLDYACGEALETRRVAAAVGRLVLCDGAPSVVAKLRERFGGRATVGFALPEDLDTELADGRTFTLRPGESYQVADHAEPHRSGTQQGATLFIVD